MNIKNRLTLLLILSLFSFSTNTIMGKGNNFIVVIDPGHGGKDPGARGKISKEKDINLAVSLLLGETIRRNHSNVKIIYTRNSDIFIPLEERANIANKIKANLFISIHTNAMPNSKITGTETYTLGTARTEENLDVAKRENAVILLEDNFSQRYEGFDPNSSESYIMFNSMQDAYFEHSINLASSIQKEFKHNLGRVDRGVRQAGFLVLRNTGMPSVLVELGYISNLEEERYLNSEVGQQNLSTSIYNAFLTFYKEFRGNAMTRNKQESSQAIEEKRQINKETENEQRIDNKAQEKTQNRIKSNTIYKIQILTSDKKLSYNSTLFKGLTPIDHYFEKGLYKYTYEATESENKANTYLRKAKQKFKDAFIIKFLNNNKI